MIIFKQGPLPGVIIRKITASRYKAAISFVFIGICAIVTAQLARYYMISSSDIFQEGAWYATFHDFRLVHLQVNYFEHGYLRRGLVGTLFHALGIEDVQFAGWLFSLSSILSFLAILGVSTASLEPERRKLLHLLFLMLIFGPSGVSQFVSTAGQIDHILLPLSAVAALAGCNGRLLLSITVFLVMYQVHELSVIAFLPILIACNFIGSRHRSRIYKFGISIPICWRSIFYFALASFVSVTLTLAYGDSPEAVRSFSGLNETRALYGEMVWGGNSPVHPVSWRGMSSALLITYYIVLILFIVTYWKNVPRSLSWISAAAVSCLLLNLVGVDAGRWAAIATWTVMVSIVATEAAGRRMLLKHPVSKPVTYLGLLLAAPLGPIGSTEPFTFTTKLLSIVRP